MIFGKFLGCHQIHERSPKIQGYQFFICYRCLGIYLGNLLGIFIGLKINILNIILITMLLPLIIDGFIQAKTKYISTNFKRFVTGIIFGIAIVILLIKIVEYIL